MNNISNTPEAVGIPWFEGQDFDRIKAVMVDGHNLHGTHAEWQRDAQELEQRLSRDGIRVVRAITKPAEFVAWCAARGLNVDSNSRKRFSSEVAAQENGKIS